MRYSIFSFFVLRDDCSDCVEISEDLASLLVNRLFEAQPSGKVRCQAVTDPCLKLLAIKDYASNYTARLSCQSSLETVKMKYQERLQIRAKCDNFSSLEYKLDHSTELKEFSHLGVHPKKISLDILTYPKIS